MAIKLVRKSRVDNSVIIYNEDEELFSLVDSNNDIKESSDTLTTLVASALWRRPTRDEASDYVFKNKSRKYTIPNADKLLSLLESKSIDLQTIKASIDDFNRLSTWAEEVGQEDPVELTTPQLNSNLSYYAASSLPDSPNVNMLIALDTEGDILFWDGNVFKPTDFTIETLDLPTIIDIDIETAEVLATWVHDIEDVDNNFLDISTLNPEESALVTDALHEMDFYLLDNATGILADASKLWIDNHDKYLRQENQSRNWHGQYDGPQAPKVRKLFSPKARVQGQIDYDIWKSILDFVKMTSESEAAAEADGNTMYVAIVDPVDTTAVLDVISIVTNPANNLPASWVRRNGEWVQDNQYLDKIRSATPPTTVVLNEDDAEDVIKQIDDSDANKEENDATEASSEEYICAALATNNPEKLPKGLTRESTILYGEYGEVITAAGVPGIADTPSDFAATARLKNYWAFGKGVAKWLPGTPGDLTRLHNHLAKYVGPNRAWGLAQNIFKMRFGITNNKFDKVSGV